jgi:sugar transferase (PEP-CTERM system associated)
MFSILNRYVPGRVLVLVLSENILILAGLSTMVLLHSRVAQDVTITYADVFWKGLLITAVCQLSIYYLDLYDLRALHSMLHVLSRLLCAIGYASLVLALLLFLFPPLRIGKGLLELSFFAIIFVILLWRLFLEWAARVFTAGERILLVGSSDGIASLADEIRLRSDLPIHLIGVVVEPGVSSRVSGVPVLGVLNDLGSIIEKTNPDRVVIAFVDILTQCLPMQELLKHRIRGLQIQEAATLYEQLSGKIPVESIHPVSLILSSGFAKRSLLKRLYERIFGIIGASLGLLLCGPLMLLTAALIKLDSPGPVFYRQLREGMNGKTFDIIKFRSMQTDAEHSGPQWAKKSDPRVTRVGAIIRKLRIDELPQFVNILRGQMSFVGPRPERPYFVDLLREKIPYFDLRHSVRPGVTGWAQVSYPYGASIDDAKEKLQYDLSYVKNMSITLDCIILFRTVKTILMGGGV